MAGITTRTKALLAALLFAVVLPLTSCRPLEPGQGAPATETGRFDSERLARSPDFIRVEGNRFVDERGETVVFMGLSIADPDKLAREGRWQKGHFERAREWGADLVRLPVHPAAWRERGEDPYLELLDQAVVWASQLDLYLMIDWHTIGDLRSGRFHRPGYETTREETRQFWRTIARHYRGVPTIAFYELFNEPTVFDGQLDAERWPEWKRFNEELIEIVFAQDRQVIPLVAGFNWAYDLKPVAEAPIESEGIGYVSHPYPQKVEPPFEEKWERDFGFVADRYPVFVTEFGFAAADERGAHIPVIAGDDYGPAVLDYFAAKGISWAAWCFDPDWSPHLISDWRYTPTWSGGFFRAAMTDRR